MSAPRASGELSLVMGGKLRTAPSRFHPLPAASRKERLASDLHRSPAWIDKAIYGWNSIDKQYAAVIASDLRAGDYDAVARWTAPALAAEMGEDVPELALAMRAYDEADVAQDAARVPLNHRPTSDLTDEELEEYARKVARELFEGARCLAAIRREQKARRA